MFNLISRIPKAQLFRYIAPRVITEISCYVTGTEKLRQLCLDHLGTDDPEVICDLLIDLGEKFFNEKED